MKALLYIKLTWSLQNGTGVYIMESINYKAVETNENINRGEY